MKYVHKILLCELIVIGLYFRFKHKPGDSESTDTELEELLDNGVSVESPLLPRYNAGSEIKQCDQHRVKSKCRSTGTMRTAETTVNAENIPSLEVSYDEESNVEITDVELMEQPDNNGNDMDNDECSEYDGSRDSSEIEEPENNGDSTGEIFAIPGTHDVVRMAGMGDNVSESEILIMIIAISVRHQLTYQTTVAMLQMMRNITICNGLPSTLNGLWKMLVRNDDIAIVRHLYCRTFKTTVGEGTEPERDCLCENTGPGKDKRSLSYFIQMKLEPQLRQLFSVPEIVHPSQYRDTRRKRNSEGIEDIYDGKKYIRHRDPGGFLSEEYNYSFTINTDGCKVSNSTKASAWPIFLTINELPPNARK